MQKINEEELNKNREKLIAWQQKQWTRKAPGIRLHLGSGHIRLSEYVNVDPYTVESDSKEDMRHLSYKPNSVSEIVSHHALEHIPIRDVWSTLQHWYEILEPGGTVEIGMPDIELCMQGFLEAPEDIRYTIKIWTLLGWQGETELNPGESKEPFYRYEQNHLGGFSLGYFVRMLEDVGFKMIDAYNYDGYGTPSLFIYAVKPEPAYPYKSILEEDVVIGTFSNKSNYVPLLWASARKHIPQIPFITRFHRNGINAGMSLLREDFIKTGKRYWCWLDDDIQFLNPDIINNALKTMIANKYGVVSVYSTFEPTSLTEPYNPTRPELTTREHRWATGYFIMIDSYKLGHILPDMELPQANTSVDTSYSVSARANGFTIGISPDYVYHQKKEVQVDWDLVKRTNDYLFNKWGQFYFDWVVYDNNVIDEGWRR